jgi:glycoprotein-N-acetylgalactosamine 3-beta-galactosyltransferase
MHLPRVLSNSFGYAYKFRPKCDGFIVGSTKTDASIGTVDIPHLGPEHYTNMWQKVRSLWTYVYDNYYDKYDWFHIGGDDMYVIVENLRLYLESEEIQTATNGGIFLPNGTEASQVPLFLGHVLGRGGDRNELYNTGGPGYTMNKVALKTLVIDGLPRMHINDRTSEEDVCVARILRSFGVFPYETRDEAWGERYHHFMPGWLYEYRLTHQNWFTDYSSVKENFQEGLDHLAARSIAFHYAKGDEMHRLHALLYHMCPGGRQ